nr:protein NRT1/ PTR FAMILY 7.3 [Ipomoea trifida]
MASMFVEQDDAMKTKVANFKIPAASMSSFDIYSMAVCIFLYKILLDPLVGRIKRSSKGEPEPTTRRMTG